MRKITLLASFVWSLCTPVLLAQAGSLQKPTKGSTSRPAAKAKALARTDGYPLDTCIVSGKPLKKTVTATVLGHEFKLCCKSCVKKLQKDPKTYVKKLEAAVLASERSAYPLTHCPISGKKLGAMGKGYELVVGNRMIKLCCKGCVKKAKANSKGILAKIDAAAKKKALAKYPAKNCPISGKKLGGMGKAYEVMHGNHLVLLCCKGCVKKFQARANEIVAKLYAKKARKSTGARPAAGQMEHKHGHK